MRMFVRFALFMAAMTSPAVAQTVEKPDSAWSISGTVGGVSDYRYRGYSLSDDGPALQAGTTLSHISGFYADVFVSTISEYGIGSDDDGADFEVTGSLGWAGEVGGFDWDAAISAYQYPDGDDVNYIELPLQISKTFSGITGTLGLAYAPSQSALGDEDNRYGWAGVTYAPEGWPVSINGTVGYEDGAFAPEGKTDWGVGVEKVFGPARLGLSYVDSDAEDGTIVVSAFLDF